MKKSLLIFLGITFLSSTFAKEEYSCPQHVVLFYALNFNRMNSCPQTQQEAKRLALEIKHFKNLCHEAEAKDIRLDQLLQQKCKIENNEFCQFVSKLSYHLTPKVDFDSELVRFLFTKMTPKAEAKKLADIFRLHYFRQELDLPPLKKEEYLPPSSERCQVANNVLKAMKFKDITLANLDFLWHKKNISDGLKKCPAYLNNLKQTLNMIKIDQCKLDQSIRKR